MVTAQARRTVDSTRGFVPVFLVPREPRDLLAIPVWTVAALLLAGLTGLVSGLCHHHAERRRRHFDLLGAVVFLCERTTRRSAAGTLVTFLSVVLVF